MRKILFMLALGALPAFALAAGNHTGGHGAPAHGLPGHDMSTMQAAPSSIGQPGNPADVSRTIEVTMDDTMRFTPGSIQVKAGETIRFLVRNKGKLPHEMVLGKLSDLRAHAAEMRKNPGMAHTEPNTVSLDGGKTGGMVWRFGSAGLIDFACLIPGHSEAGMVGTIEVS